MSSTHYQGQTTIVEHKFNEDTDYGYVILEITGFHPDYPLPNYPDVTEDGLYFYDETGSVLHGPFQTFLATIRARCQYDTYLNNRTLP